MTRASGATDRLREAILGGDLGAGARLGEVELAERLGLSRTPVREALSRLAAEGLVDLRPQRGARVASFSDADLDGVFDVRLALEPEATARAVAAASPADVDALDALATTMLERGGPGPAQDLDGLVEPNRAFHTRLIALAAVPALTSALQTVMHTPVVLRTFRSYDPASLARSLAHHAEIVAAMRAGDVGWARAVMHAHLGNARATVLPRRGAR